MCAVVFATVFMGTEGDFGVCSPLLGHSRLTCVQDVCRSGLLPMRPRVNEFDWSDEMNNATCTQTMGLIAQRMWVPSIASADVHIAPLTKPAAPRTACSQL